MQELPSHLLGNDSPEKHRDVGHLQLSAMKALGSKDAELVT